jgi:hypothetical protein
MLPNKMVKRRKTKTWRANGGFVSGRRRLGNARHPAGSNPHPADSSHQARHYGKQPNQANTARAHQDSHNLGLKNLKQTH